MLSSFREVMVELLKTHNYQWKKFPWRNLIERIHLMNLTREGVES